MVHSLAEDLERIAGPIGPAVNEQIGVKWTILSRRICKECISTVGLSLLNVIHHTVMSGLTLHSGRIRKELAGPIGPAVNEQTLVKWTVLSRQIGKELPAL